jgi:glycosyltransferase involved in cell wall biosynthesis
MESGQMAYFYVAGDVVLCPHRKLYEYSLSGVPNMAALAKKPMVVPDFYFFNEIIRRFKNGVIYEPENPESMAKAVVYCFENYDKIMTEAKFEESLTGYVDGTDTPLKILKKLGL